MRCRKVWLVPSISIVIILCLRYLIYEKSYEIDGESLEETKNFKTNVIPGHTFMTSKPRNAGRKRRKHLVNEIRHRIIVPSLMRSQRRFSFKEVREDFVDFYENASISTLSDPLLHFHKFEFLLNNPLLCSMAKNVLFVTCIHSAPTNFPHRARIRETFAGVSFLNGYSLPVVFIVGQVYDVNLQREIEKENSTHGDIIQGNFIDSYRNLTYKNVFGLHWVLHHCSSTKFVVKIDDDVLVNPYHVTEFLHGIKTLVGGIDFIMCSVYINQGPVRYTSDKWFIPKEEYPYSKFPNYCEGYAYILSIHTVKTLYQASTQVPFFWVDDVYVTGFLAYVARIKHRWFTVNHNSIIMKRKYSQSELNCTMFYLEKYTHGLKLYWKQTWENISTETYRESI